MLTYIFNIFWNTTLIIRGHPVEEQKTIVRQVPAQEFSGTVGDKQAKIFWNSLFLTFLLDNYLFFLCCPGVDDIVTTVKTYGYTNDLKRTIQPMENFQVTSYQAHLAS